MAENTLQQISAHVWWMPPAKPDRPSLCAVVGERSTVMLDSGASDAHARLFLDQLASRNLPAPHFVVLTHWHWDHTFGTVEIGAPIIAHPMTAKKIEEMRGYSWDDEAMADRVAAGLGIPTPGGMKDIQEEVPENPRQVRFLQPDLIVDGSLTIDLGGVTCRVQHVGGDHAADSCVIYVVEDRVLFLGDSLYPCIFPKYYYTPQKILALVDALQVYDVEAFVEGHRDQIMSREEAATTFGKMRAAGTLMQEKPDADMAALMTEVAERGLDTTDEELGFLISALVTGRDF